MGHFSCFTLLSALLLPAVLTSELYSKKCQNVKCPAGQECNLVKPCPNGVSCDVIARCTERMPELSYGCDGNVNAIVHEHLITKKFELVLCDYDYQCPSNTFCSSYLQDVASRCCPKATVTSTKPGQCPAPRMQLQCYFKCSSDDDCERDEKCCSSACSNGATVCSKPITTTVTKPPAGPKPTSCHEMKCPAGQECNLVKPCQDEEKCDVYAECTKPVKYLSQGCNYGNAVIYKNYFSNSYEVDSCNAFDKCPSGTYCSRMLQDVPPRCCPTEIVKTVKKGACPAIKSVPLIWFCYNECLSDGDCWWDQKCCESGCSNKSKTCKRAV